MKTTLRNLLSAAALLLPALLFARGYTIQSIVDTHFEGGLGSVVGMAARMTGHNLRNVATTTYLQGHQLRTDNALSGMIYDLDAERVITIDHKEKTYSSMTFAEMSAAMEKARKSAEQSRAKEAAKASKADPATATKDGEVKVKYHVQVDRPGTHDRSLVPGYDAEHVYVTITLDAEATPDKGKAEQIGSMVLLLDQWITKDAPLAPAYAEFYRLFSKKLGREFKSQMQGMQAMFASDPRMKDGFEAAAKELQKVQGIPLSSTTHVVLVPVNMTFNRDQAVSLGSAAQTTAAAEVEAEKSEKPKGGFRGFLGKVKTVAVEAGKQLEKAGQKNDAPPRQSTLLEILDRTTSVAVGAVPAAMFAPPAGYREVKQKTL